MPGVVFPQNINKIAVDDQVLLDLSEDTVESDVLAEGYTAHNKDGQTVNGSLHIPTGTKQITQAGETDVEQYAKVNVPAASLSLSSPTVSSTGLVTAAVVLGQAGWISSAPGNKTLQLTTQAAKTVTPSTSEQTAVDSGRYTTGIVKVAAVQTEEKSITTNGTYTPSSGKFFSKVVVNVPGIAPTGTLQITQAGETDVTQYAKVNVPSASLSLSAPTVNSSGLVTAAAVLGQAGWISSAPSNKTLQLTTQAAKTVTPSTSEQTAVASGRYTTGDVKVAAIQTETKTAALDMASGNQVVQNTSGKYITQVTITKPSTLIPGNIKKDVNIGGVVGTLESGGGQITVEALSVTENGTYTAPSGKAYSPVTVNVSGGGGKNIQYYAGMKSIAKSSLSSTGVKVTVEKTGNYKISWMAARGSSSGTMSTRLYVNSSAKDTERTTWTQTYGQQITISSFALTEGQTVEIYGKSGSTSRYVMVGQLVIEEL